MKSDNNGCSTTAPGSENFEIVKFRSGRKKHSQIQYDYRHTDGELFSCISKTLISARDRRDEWLQAKIMQEDYEREVLYHNRLELLAMNEPLHVMEI